MLWQGKKDTAELSHDAGEVQFPYSVSVDAITERDPVIAEQRQKFRLSTRPPPKLL